MKLAKLFFRLMAAGLVSVTASAHAQPVQDTASAPARTSTALTSKTGRAENRRLCKSVRQALVKTRKIDTQNIATICHSGVVTLAGTAPEQRQIDIAVSAAEAASGVTSVKNALTVRGLGD